MELIRFIKNFIPILFGISFVLSSITLSVFAFLGKFLFTTKSYNLGILFCILSLVVFYPGMLLGGCILYLINKCLPPREEKIKLKFDKMFFNNKKFNNIIETKITIDKKSSKYIDF